MQQILIYIIIIIVVLAIALRIAVPFLSAKPDNLGITDGQLAPCPNSPNCVSSFDDSQEHGIAPISFGGNAEETRTKLLAVLKDTPRLTIVSQESTYIHATTRSRLMGYVDDNEFLFDEAAGVIHVRAAARMGHSDLGANRARVEQFRSQMQ